MQKWLNSVSNALNGFTLLAREERNLKIELAAAFIVVFLGIYFQISLTEWAVILLCIAGVLSSEALNTSIEKLCDHISPAWNVQIGHIKDLAAAGVLIISMFSLIIGLLIFAPKLIQLIQ